MVLPFPSDQLSIEVNGSAIAFRRVDGHDELVKELNVTKAVDITCTAISQLSTPDELPALQANLRDVCSLLSLACGTRIDWLSYDVLSSTGNTLVTVCRNSVTKRFGTSYRN